MNSIKRFLHWGPLIAISIIKIITIMTLYMNSMWWPPNQSLAAFINHKLFLVLSTLTAFNFVMAAITGPHHVPLKWRPKNAKDEHQLQYCTVCEGFKAPRSHHCRKCGRCVLKMDHHCPWINNCVGWANHAYFTYFLFFAVVGCAHAAYILLFSLIRGLHRNFYIYYGQRELATVEFTVTSLIFCVLSLGLSIGVVIAVGMLLFFQVRAICRNRTGIEDWILEKAKYRRERTNEEFIFPYSLGVKRNFRQVFKAFYSCEPVGDGIWWEVDERCDQFTLTREQIEQKNEKRARTKTYRIVKPATGSWLPLWSQGIRVCLRPPCTDETRIKLEVNDIVRVTRWNKYWLFGEKVVSSNGTKEAKPVRGWFPRQCAVELIECDDNGDYFAKQQQHHSHQQHATRERKKVK